MITSAEIAQHGDSGLRGRLRVSDHEGGTDEPSDFGRAPLEIALLVRPRLRHAAELGQEAVTRARLVQQGSGLGRCTGTNRT